MWRLDRKFIQEKRDRVKDSHIRFGGNKEM